jgi:peptidyl-prolyl cis-trans isomerase SurA
MLNVRLQGRIRVTDEDLRGAYQKIVTDERRRQNFRLAWIVLRAPAESPELGRRRQLAERLSQQAAAGEDFAALALRHSDDESSRDRGGLLPQMKGGQLPPTLERAALALEVGQVSQPLRQGEAYYVLKLIERDASKLPRFEEARSELAERVYMEKMNKARRHWLDGLRNRTHIEVRL